MTIPFGERDLGPLIYHLYSPKSPTKPHSIGFTKLVAYTSRSSIWISMATTTEITKTPSSPPQIFLPSILHCYSNNDSLQPQLTTR
ncbi:hypothetical protein L2E82_47397 [Cichorium intybus]|uniref:Uncharacterized protein n=1 Tax=Cichorium intybus TaxID=13427 RepID=A0ACB8YZJ4_CICIN|nr:hypothetical protein L2E82_47397 [Cichorium intybus]